MGWTIDINKKGDKYRIYSSVVDQYITKWLTKEEFIRFLFWDKFEDLVRDMVKQMIYFPGGWVNNKTYELIGVPEKETAFFSAIAHRRDRLYNEFFSTAEKCGITILQMRTA